MRSREKKKDDFPAVVNGFTGSSIWHSIYAFPPTDQAYWGQGFCRFRKRFGPILQEFDKQNVNFASKFILLRLLLTSQVRSELLMRLKVTRGLVLIMILLI